MYLFTRLKMKKFSYIYILLFYIAVSFISIAQGAIISPEVIEFTRKSIVSIETRVSHGSCVSKGRFTGTGFVNDLKKGLIITNRHVIGGPCVGDYLVTFSNGQKLQAKVMYYDDWLDFAVLQFDPAQAPADLTEIKFSNKLPKQNQGVFIIGSNEGQSFSFHDGYLSNLNSVAGIMPQHSYVINLNSTGGSSGSPIVGEDGLALGLNYAAARTYSLAIKGQYIQDALVSLAEGKNPSRRHIGVICALYSLDDAVRHRKFPKDLAQKYLKDFPDARNNILVVKSSLIGSPAVNYLKSGDIIWAIDGKRFGPSLYDFDSHMNFSNSEKIVLTIYRDGQKLDFNINLYDINEHKITKMVEFAGAMIFEANDVVSYLSGIAAKSVVLSSEIQQGMSMSVIPTYGVGYDNVKSYRIKLLSLGGFAINNLDSLLSSITKLNRNKFTFIEFENYQAYHSGMDDYMISAHEILRSDITLDNADFSPRVFFFNNKELEWQLESAN